MIYIVDSVLEHQGGTAGVSWHGREVLDIGHSRRYRRRWNPRRLPWGSRARVESDGKASDLEALQ
jgi:hypothetical protein